MEVNNNNNNNAEEQYRLSADQIAHFEKEGYIIIPNAISKAMCEETLDEIWEMLSHYGAKRDDPDTWNGSPFTKIGFINSYPVFHLQSVWNIRQTPKVYESFSQILNTKELWVGLDRLSMKRPGKIGKSKTPKDWQLEDWYHTDVNPHHLPKELAVQGFVALTDTSVDQGSLHIVPGWHHDIEAWAAKHPEKEHHPEVTLCRFNDKSVTSKRTRKLSFKAGDLLIFNSKLVHGSYPNQTDQFRSFVYVAYAREKESNYPLLKSRLDSYESGRAPSLMPSGSAGPKPQNETFPYKIPQLNKLGRKLLGMDSWYIEDDQE